jgi:hypothetical protein
MNYGKIMIVMGLLGALTIFFSRCLSTHSTGDPRGDQYAGSSTCIRCHQGIVNSYAHNDHYKTSSPVDKETLGSRASYSGGKDRFYFSDSSYIRLEEKSHALFQSYFTTDQPTVSEKFDVAFGSGEKAQTYAYWKDDQLLQLPLTWFTGANVWANSPGFSARHARYGRVITSRCFECHGSYVERAFVRSGPLSVTENLDKSSIIYGIDCERCHGPAASHVQYQEANPTAKTGKYITSIKTLSRQQQLDLCGTCHSGNDQSAQRSLFSFVPGDTLSHFYFPDFGADNHEPDVHGKQVQLLRASRCFQATDMTCTTCHNPHMPETNALTAFISKCMDCHRNSAHAVNILKDNEQKKRDFNLSTSNCIDCHMPLQTSKTIYSNNGAETKNISYLIRTHKIGIYK